ncbi:MAG: hypothetical protein AAGH79_19465 [Bacteroidota bacterium]
MGILRIKTEELTLDLVLQFLRMAQEDDPQRIISPRNMMEWVGAPVHDANWFRQQTPRVKQLDRLLHTLHERGVLEITEIGYRVKPYHSI